MDRGRSVIVLLAMLSGAACRSMPVEPAVPIVQPGAPGEPSRVISARQATDLSQLRYTAAEVQFIQGMIGHHQQAIEMTALVSARTSRADMQMLARRIEISQADEIQMMGDWLKARGALRPDPHAHHAAGAKLMPGMLTADEMQQLAEAKGDEFDRLFLTRMISHHEGALIMVEELFSTPGAGQQSDTFAFASDVDADQRMEIARMSAMLREGQK